jgi:hypothetical protein
VYYNCTRRKDPNCPEKYINEENLCVLLQAFIEQNYKDIRITDKLQAKIEKHYHTTQTLLGHYKIDQKLDEPLIEYARYILSRGTENDRTAFAAGIETKLQIRESQLLFQR